MSILIEPSSPSRATPHAQRADSSPTTQSIAAFLVVEQDGKRFGGPIAGRILIGRREANHIVVPDRNIARIHAWIINVDGRYALCDTGSRAGTLINMRRVQGRQILQDGDEIRVGPVTIHYRIDPSAIDGAEPIDLRDRPLSTNRPNDGQFVDCACGAPLWVPWDFAGKMGQCRYCAQTVIVQTKLAVVPAQPRCATPPAQRADSSAAPPAPAATPSTALVCGICQSPITAGESQHACPSCHIPFHADCWNENRGCSSYGCSQVSVLDHSIGENGKGETTQQSEELIEEFTGDAAFAEQTSTPPPWEFLILAGAVLGSVIGAWTFGLPALAAAIAAALGLRKPTKHRPILVLALAFAAIGAVAGIAISYFWWFTFQRTGIQYR
jgi:pSer/pThr/pTyr-binding forkhead associated (FHA) protein